MRICLLTALGLSSAASFAQQPLFQIAAPDAMAAAEQANVGQSSAAELSQSLGDAQIDALQGLTLTEIRILGIEDEKQLNNAEVFLGLSRVKGEAISQPAYVNYLIDNGAKEIALSQQPFGFYQSEVRSERHIQEGNLIVTYHVNLNAPTTIRAVEVNVSGMAADDPEFQQLLTENPFREGEVLSHEQYETYKARFLELAVARGYFDGQFTSNVVKVNTDTQNADIALFYDSGQRFDFANVNFTPAAEKDGSTSPIPLDEDLLQRFVQFQTGQAYSAKEVEQLQHDLQGSGYFKQVLVGGRPDTQSKTVPVEAQLTMNSNKRYLFGIGYSTDSGVRGKIDFDWRWVNSRGHTFSSSLYASQKQGSWDNIYRIPAANPTTDYYFLRFGGWIKEDDYDTKRGFIEGGYNWRKNQWEYRVSGTAAYDKFSIGNDRGEITLTYPQFQATYSSTDNRLNPDSGFQARIGVLGGVKGVGSDVSFAQANVNFRYIQSLNAQNRLLFRFDGGSTWTDNFHRLPPNLRYFAGGDRSVRGYAYEKIGNYDSSGDNIGGRHLLVGSVQYEYFFKPDWAVAAFVDAGDAFNNNPKAHIGAGLGLHWRSPVGPINIDVGHGFDKDVGDNYRLHLTIGTELDL